MNHDQLKIGQRIYYTGDRANVEDFGTIKAIRPANKWAGMSYDILLDDDRKFNGVFPNNFEGIGKRFMTQEEYDKERETRIANFKKWSERTLSKQS